MTIFEANSPANFDRARSDRIADLVVEGIRQGSIDPATGETVLRHDEIAAALMTVASSLALALTDPEAPIKVDVLTDQFTGSFRKALAGWLRPRLVVTNDGVRR